jgi:O-methyltransferase involved in polyketide biosynthesis
MPKATAQRIAIACLILAVFDGFMGQKTLAMVFAGVAIAVSLGSGLYARAMRKNGKGR